jgi:hypothetical protein
MLSPLPASSPLSVLFDRIEDRGAADRATEPACFTDLHLDQVVQSLCSGRTEYRLEPFFHWPLRRLDAIAYRHEVFRDLEQGSLLRAVRLFSSAMRDVSSHMALVGKLSDRHHKDAWLVETIQAYCSAAATFARELASLPICSEALTRFSGHLNRYTTSEAFTALRGEGEALLRQLSRVSYRILIHGNSFTVDRYDNEADYSAEIETTFAKFRRGAASNHLIDYKDSPQDMNHVEAKILQFVGQLNPELFTRLTDYARRHPAFVDDVIDMFERDIQFYLAWLDHISRHTDAGLRFCLPEMSNSGKDLDVVDGFDLALANKLGRASTVVCNDMAFAGRERILVVSGPNQGGKTTYARMFGQLYYLASLGCPVPARTARLGLFDDIYTHFEKEEKVDNLRGKLEDDLVRVRAILDKATARSIVVFNEIFTSTTIQDEVFLSRKVMQALCARDVVGVWVTFVDELAAMGPQTVSMTSTIVPDNPPERTFKVVRRPADGLAYAMAIAEKYKLTHDHIVRRVAS